jgi:hypothetical protein
LEDAVLTLGKGTPRFVLDTVLDEEVVRRRVLVERMGFDLVDLLVSPRAA